MRPMSCSISRGSFALLGVSFLLALSLLATVTPGPASAVEAKPFAITKFTMQTTAPTKVVSLGSPSW